MAKVKVKFRNSTVEGKAGVIYYQLCHKCQSRQITTGIRLFPEQWDALRERAVVPFAGLDGEIAVVQRQIDGDLCLFRAIIGDFEARRVEYGLPDVVGRFRAGYRFRLYRKADRLPSGGRKIGDGAELPADAEQLRRIFERSGHSVLTAGRTTGKPVRRLAAAETDCTQYRLFLYAGAACRFQQGGPGGHRVAKFSFPECLYRRGPYPQARRRRRDRHTAPAVESGTLPLLGAGAGYFYFQLLRAGYGVRRYRLPAQAGHRRRGDMLCPPQNGTAPYDPYRTLHGRYHRTLCAGYPHVGLCFSFVECGGPGPGILPVPDCSGILQPPAQTAGRTARTGDAAVVLYFAAYMGDHGPESQRSVVDHQCGNGTCFGENDPDLSGFARKLRRRSGEPEHNSFIVCVISLGKRP